MKQIGLVGLGNAGRPLGERLLHKGFPLKVYDLNPDTAEPLVKLGAEIAGSAEEATCDVTLTILPSSVEVRTAVLGQRGVLGGIRPGFTLIDLSGTDPDCARELQQQIRDKNGEFLGGTLHASGAPSVTIPKGLLSIVIGGKRETIESCMEVLKALAQKIICVNEPWSPKAMKIAVILFAIADNIIATEICTWLQAQKIDPKTFLGLLQTTGSRASASRIDDFLARNKSYGGTLSNIEKDIRQALEVASDLNLSLPFTESANQIVERSGAQGSKRITPLAAFANFYESQTKIDLSQAVKDRERTFPEPQEPQVYYLEEIKREI